MFKAFSRNWKQKPRNVYEALGPEFESLLVEAQISQGSPAMIGEIAEVIGQARSQVVYWGPWLDAQKEPPIGGFWDPESDWSQSLSPSLWIAISEDLPESRDEQSFGILVLRDASEASLLRSAMLSCEAVAMSVSGFDKYQLQYLTELARDLHLSLLWFVSDREELDRVLQTDAPYVAVYYAQKAAPDPFEGSIRPCHDWDLREKIPPAMRGLCVFSSSSREVESFLTRIAAMNYSAYIDVSRS